MMLLMGYREFCMTLIPLTLTVLKLAWSMCLMIRVIIISLSLALTKGQLQLIPGQYNAPTTNGVAVLLVNQECDEKDIVLRIHDVVFKGLTRHIGLTMPYKIHPYFVMERMMCLIIIRKYLLCNFIVIQFSLI